MNIEEILANDEKQSFERKSILVKPTDLSQTVCAFANADGGTIAIGISDKLRRIEGIDYNSNKLNEILRVPIDFCSPTVRHTCRLHLLPSLWQRNRLSTLTLQRSMPGPSFPIRHSAPVRSKASTGQSLS